MCTHRLPIMIIRIMFIALVNGLQPSWNNYVFNGTVLNKFQTSHALSYAHLSTSVLAKRGLLVGLSTKLTIMSISLTSNEKSLYCIRPTGKSFLVDRQDKTLLRATLSISLLAQKRMRLLKYNISQWMVCLMDGFQPLMIQ